MGEMEVVNEVPERTMVQEMALHGLLPTLAPLGLHNTVVDGPNCF